MPIERFEAEITEYASHLAAGPWGSNRPSGEVVGALDHLGPRHPDGIAKRGQKSDASGP
jgi:hypothetical protein